jgi:hypothetical protein
MREELDSFLSLVETSYNVFGWSSYDHVLEQINGLPISDEGKEDLIRRFPPRGCAAPAEWDEDEEDEDFAEAYLKNPPDPGPLSQFADHGWIQDELDEYRDDPFYQTVRARIGISDEEVVHDIMENTLHILGRCNNPADWGPNRQGLVFGMVQSGKTASMINLVAAGIRAGYKLFIVLAGDKSSLRDQTQDRFNTSFKLENGTNKATRVFSPTWDNDFGNTGYAYTGSFKTQMLQVGKQYATIIVIKKEKHHLRNLLDQLKLLRKFCQRNGIEMADAFPTMVLDDEADYASQNTKPTQGGSTIWKRLCEIRNDIPKNCYVAYTATPQACLSANPKDPIGYPNDFLWLLEPFIEYVDGQPITRTYLGAWDIFWQYDNHLIQNMGRNEWPHYEKDPEGKDAIWFPYIDGADGEYVEWEDLPEDEDEYGEEPKRPTLDSKQLEFLEQTRDGIRPIPPSLIQALSDFLIGCGLRWWTHWKRKDTSGFMPGRREIESSYPHHAVMVHLSRLQQHQVISRGIVENAWGRVTAEWRDFDIDNAPPDHLFNRRWSAQKFRTSRLRPDRGHMPFSEIVHFINHAISIANEPIRDDNSATYQKYPGDPYIYLVNSGDTGMRLHYDLKKPEEIQTKRAAIIVGGQILSRGLTIEGLSVSFFGRAAKLPMGDTTLQMGRWFGHKKGHIDLISIYMQDGVRQIFRQIAEADRYLRIQFKDAVIRGLRPDQILIELRNSPQFRSTSPAKSKFVNFSMASGYSGRRALLREPTMKKETIKANNKRLEKFQTKHESRVKEVHGKRALLYPKVTLKEALSLLRGLNCKRDAIQDSYSDYARYLKDWSEGEELRSIPDINIAVMKNRRMRRKRQLSISKPETAEDARACASGVFGAIIGGSAHGTYRGDYFLDKDEKWHLVNESPSKQREAGDDILIVFYGLQPNYLRNKLFDPTDTDDENEQGKWRSEMVFLEEGDPQWLDVDPEDSDYSIIVFAAFTPRGGPQYGVGVNTLLDPDKIEQIGLVNLNEEDAES